MKVTLITDYRNNQLEEQVRTWTVCHVLEKYGLETAVWSMEKGEVRNEQKEDASLFQKLGQLFRGNAKEEQEVLKDFLDTYGTIEKRCASLEELKAVDGTADSYISLRREKTENGILDLSFLTTDQKYVIRRDPLFWLQEKDFEVFDVSPSKQFDFVLDFDGKLDTRVEAFTKQMNGTVHAVQNKDCTTKSFKAYLEALKGAKKVITNTALGAIVAITHYIPFVYVEHGEKDLTAGILEGLKLESHIIRKNASITEENFAWDIQAKTMNTRLRRWRRKPLYEIEEAFRITTNEERVLCPTNILKKECYGCYACEKVCPTKAITMVEDKDGFPYPVTNEETCINCGACERACIRLKESNCMEEGFPKVRAVMNRKLDVRMGGSSSGAVFPELCKQFIEERNGVVVGVTYDENMQVVSKIAETLEEAKAFRNSKYVKSQFAQNFPKVKELLQQGRYVLYTGLPCECAALRSYLRKDYDNLLIQEILCHAGPAPRIFGGYIKALEEEHGSKVTNFVFRDKQKGWHMSTCSVVITFENGKEIVEYAKFNDYFKAFLNDYLGRPSCSHCQFVASYRSGDLTVGDFWGIQNLYPKLYDNKGISLLMINTEKGWKYWQEIHERFVVQKSNMREAFKKNHSKPSPYKEERVQLFHKLEGKNPKEIAQLLHEYNNAIQENKK